MKTTKNPLRKRTWGHIFHHLKPHAPLVILSVLCALGTTVLALYVPLLFGQAIDLMTEGATDWTALGSLFLRIHLLVGITAVLRWCMEFINRRITYLVTRDIRTEVFAHTEHLPLSYLDAHPTGETVSRVITDTDTFAEGLLLGFTQMFTGLLTIVGTFICMLTIRVEIALLVALLTPLSLFIARFIATRTHSLFRRQAQTQGEQTACIDEMIGQIKTVKAYGYEASACDTFREVNTRLGDVSLKATFFSSLVNPTTRFVNSVIYAAVALSGALLTITSVGSSVPFTIGSLTALLAYVNQYTKPFNEISGVIAEFQNALTSADRVFALKDEPTEPITHAKDAHLTDVRGDVTLDDVRFFYRPERPLIEHLCLSVKAGEHIAIVGPTGCGKTTLINLLMRFYDVKGGAIRIDGVDIRDVSRADVRTKYGMVLQDTWLKHASVLENLRYGRPEATEEEVMEAARIVHAHGFITRMKDGYATVLDEGGGQLSAGQKQLLAIARTLICRPTMLILDEATSSIDTRTEAYVSEAFDLLMKGRTSFLVAHRLSTVVGADCILVMRDGNIIEQGTHAELMEKGGFYRTLYNSQFAHIASITSASDVEECK